MGKNLELIRELYLNQYNEDLDIQIRRTIEFVKNGRVFDSDNLEVYFMGERVVVAPITVKGSETYFKVFLSDDEILSLKERYEGLLIPETLDGFDLTDKQIFDFIIVETIGEGESMDNFGYLDVEMRIQSDGRVIVVMD